MVTRTVLGLEERCESTSIFNARRTLIFLIPSQRGSCRALEATVFNSQKVLRLWLPKFHNPSESLSLYPSKGAVSNSSDLFLRVVPCPPKLGIPPTPCSKASAQVPSFLSSRTSVLCPKSIVFTALPRLRVLPAVCDPSRWSSCSKSAYWRI